MMVLLAPACFERCRCQDLQSMLSREVADKLFRRSAMLNETGQHQRRQRAKMTADANEVRPLN
jgi:hypothetical protein